MFTGIVESVGLVTAVRRIGGDLRVQVSAPALNWKQVQLGDSIATNGVCLTVIERVNEGFSADVSVETLAQTTVEGWQVGTRVNLEQALTPTTRMGGHLVSGHVDGVGEVLERAPAARSEQFVIRAPAALARYIAQKGSITVDGTSLTVNKVEGDCFWLNIVPFTLDHTVIADYRTGTRVNLEVDLLARYLERLLAGGVATAGAIAQSPLSAAFLADNGYMK